MKPLRRLSLLLLVVCATAPLFHSPAQAGPAGHSDDDSVTLYSAPWCGYCAKARDYLSAQGIAYREIDIASPAGKAAFAEVGGTGNGVPLLIAGERRILGFSTRTYDTVFASPPLAHR
jgi:glutaredoxin